MPGWRLRFPEPELVFEPGLLQKSVGSFNEEAVLDSLGVPSVEYLPGVPIPRKSRGNGSFVAIYFWQFGAALAPRAEGGVVGKGKTFACKM